VTVRIISDGITHEFPDDVEIIIEAPEDLLVDGEKLEKELAQIKLDLDKIRETFNNHTNVTSPDFLPLIPLPPTRWQRFKKRFKYQVWKFWMIAKYIVTSSFKKDDE